MKAYLLTLVAIVRWQVVWALALTLSLGFLQGIGILMLVPLLEFIGLSDGKGAIEGISTKISFLFQIVGLPKTLTAVLLVFLFLMCLREGLLRLHTIYNAELQQRFVLILQERLYRAIAYANWLFFVRTRSSDFVQTLTADINRIGNGTHFLIQFVSTGILLGVYAFLAFWLSPLMTATTAICGFAVLFLLRHKTHLARISGKQS